MWRELSTSWASCTTCRTTLSEFFVQIAEQKGQYKPVASVDFSVCFAVAQLWGCLISPWLQWYSVLVYHPWFLQHCWVVLQAFTGDAWSGAAGGSPGPGPESQQPRGPLSRQETVRQSRAFVREGASTQTQGLPIQCADNSNKFVVVLPKLSVRSQNAPVETGTKLQCSVNVVFMLFDGLV